MTGQQFAPAYRWTFPLSAEFECHCEQVERPRRIWATGVTKTRAEAILDWLDAQVHGDCRVTYVAGEGYTVVE
jgi:hypothetical protein